MTLVMVEQLPPHLDWRRRQISAPAPAMVIPLAASSVPTNSVFLDAVIFWSVSQFGCVLPHRLQEKSRECWARFRHFEQEVGSMRFSLEAGRVSDQIGLVLEETILYQIALHSLPCVGF